MIRSRNFELVDNWLKWSEDGGMSLSVGAFEAKTHLSSLLRQVELGEEVTITKHGRPIARLVPVNQGASRDWKAFWARVDEHRVRGGLSAGIKGHIEEGRM